MEIANTALAIFQGWIARYYSRIALPDALDQRLQKRKFYKKVRSVLNDTLNDHNQLYTVHSDVDLIYVYWDPKRELASTETILVRFLFICGKAATRDYLLEKLTSLGNRLKRRSVDQWPTDG